MGTSAKISLRAALFASVSVVALSVASPQVRAADMPPAPMYTKAPPPVAPQWRWYLEGGAFWTGGDQIGILPSWPTDIRPGAGWEIAGGFDYRFAGTPWHVNGQVRYARAGDRTLTNSIGTINFIGTAKEHHLVADFAAGHDIGIGLGAAQVNLGVRVADLYAKEDLSVSSTGVAAYSVDNFRSRFLGAGPRASLEGSVPLGGALSFDYMAGAAVLFGERKLDTAGTVGTAEFSDHPAVFNADAMAGLSYAFTQTIKLTAGYQFDGYWNALKGVDFTSGVSFPNVDRFYYGPFLRATAQF